MTSVPNFILKSRLPLGPEEIDTIARAMEEWMDKGGALIVPPHLELREWRRLPEIRASRPPRRLASLLAHSFKRSTRWP